ncbi:MAG: UvrD-helicase domain-containing protein [Paludibacteraceae bacterium]|nr:UvrD-helicase domain-containing protein [Paludibacteraceae bacterium]
MEERNESLLKIYKASAGSGKTYRLTMEFLKYIIEDPTSFERILAVTFTNKATAEMKSRIITTLYGIAKNLDDSQGDITVISDELGAFDAKSKSRSYIVSQAKIALSLMLHNYSNFHIETIDSFFQTVLRNLEKELGLGTHLNIEIEEAPVLSETVASLLENITTDKTLFKWVQYFLADKLKNEKSWNISDEIVEFGKALFTEKFRKKSKPLFEFLSDMNNHIHEEKLYAYRTKLENYRDECERKIQESAHRFFLFNDKHGFVESDYMYGAAGIPSYFNKIERGDYAFDGENGIGKRVIEFIDEKKNFSKNNALLSLIDEVHDILVETEKIRCTYILEINTADLIIDNLFKVGLLNYMDLLMQKINEEKNQFILSETQALLNEMVADDDAPFIYEKIGTYLDHIMIDEFQDTSETQWLNFKPLINECASRNMSSLIVGDQKQSIYRFRNGKWQLLGELSDEMAHISPAVIPLNVNWRSEQRIVEFNNFVFENFPALYRNSGIEHPLLESMIDAYRDVKQNCKKGEKADRGYVKVQFLEGENTGEYVEETLSALAEEVKSMQQQGVKPEQMTILIRKNNQVPLIAEYFAWFKEQEGNEGYCFELISEDAYKLETSEAIQCIISAMRYIVLLRGDIRESGSIQKNNLALTQLLHAYGKIGHKEEIDVPPSLEQLTDEQKEIIESIEKLVLLPLYEMVEEIYRVMRLDRIGHQESYYCFFLDRINEFLIKKSSDLRLFLRYWDDYLHKMTIPSGEASGIRIMSIHKSKGLEFHTVLIPFCDWNLGPDMGTNAPLLWENIDNLGEQYNKLPLAAVMMKKSMAQSHFAQSYNEEYVEAFMDNLNVLYVALTRAEKNMVIFAKRKKDSKKNETKADSIISHRLATVLRLYPNGEWNAEGDLFIDGKLFVDMDGRMTENSVSKNPFKRSPDKFDFKCVSFQQKGKFRQSNKSNDFIEDNEASEWEEHNEYINRGKLLHYLFSNIATASDVDEVVNKMEFDGLIESDDQKRKILESMRKAMATEEAKRWFRPGLKLYNECSILFRDENGEMQVRRPDRVVREGNHMTVIDFKFGKRLPKHDKQISEYVSLLKKMGYQAEGHIWYLNELFV